MNRRRILKHVLVLVFFLRLAGSSFAGVLHPMADFDYTPQIGKATAEFHVPAGWDALPVQRNTTHQAIVLPPASGNAQHRLVVTIDFYHFHSFETNRTQQGRASTYLDGIRRHDDPRVEMDVASTFQSARNGVLKIYRYHSANLRERWERWAVFIVKGGYNVKIEIYAPDFADAALASSYLRLIADVVSISGPTD